MRLLKKEIFDIDYLPKKEIIYQDKQLSDIYNDININSNLKFTELLPVRRVLKDFLDQRRSKPRIDEKYIFQKKKTILIKGNDIKKAMFIESIDFFLKSIYCYLVQYNLAKRGYDSWARITNYYSSFFSIHSLLRLEGRAVTRIWKPPLGTKFFVFPFDFKKSSFVVTAAKGRGDHKITWHEYYKIFDRFNFPNKDFEVVYKLRDNDGRSDTEVEYRNDINYRVCYKFNEIWDPGLIKDFIKEYINNSLNQVPTIGLTKKLNYLSTDPDHMYFAKSALRILLVFRLIETTVSANTSLGRFWSKRKNSITKFLEETNKRQFVTDRSTLGRDFNKFIKYGF